ncbi:unnamed protein product [Rotaria sp. Silwood1]|nr:unnamed protein product [Rotaria sp. Silwood1]CAF4831200.1 unnamed protein product [Rotaria sp. Silwood1]
MINKLEIFPNEIFLNIFSYLFWDELLISFWSLNKRINSLICSIFRVNGILLNKPGLSYKNFSKILLRIIFNSSSLLSSIKCIHVDGMNSISLDLIYEKIFCNDNKPTLCFPNLKSLYISQCLLSEPLTHILCSLIQYQLNELTISFHEDIYEIFDYGRGLSAIASDQEKVQRMFKQLLCKIFSDQCQLTSLKLDITKSFNSIHQCLNLQSHLEPNTISKSCCLTLRRLCIHIDHKCFLEHLIEHTPNLEQLSVHFRNFLFNNDHPDSDTQALIISNGNWFNKISKLECFKLKSYVRNDLEFAYLKCLLNNVNHVKKLEIHLYSEDIGRSFIDANFIREYCLPDHIINLKDFRFYMCAKCQLSLNDTEKIINSFKINSFFIDHQWTNVKCFYDENISYQHIFSSNFDKYQYFDHLLNYRYILNDLLDPQHIKINFDPSLYSFFEQFNELCPNAFCITIDTVRFSKFTGQDKVRAKIFAHLISMPVQLKYLSLAKFQWLLYVIENAFDDLRENALSTVRHAEFGIPTCNFGYNESVQIGKHLVPFLNMYMPHLQTLRLWRPDDFPWTSNEHATIFEQDLSQLVEQLKQFVFLDIYGNISSKKVKPYRLMVQTRFSNSRFDVHISRFRLWM